MRDHRLLQLVMSLTFSNDKQTFVHFLKNKLFQFKVALRMSPESKDGIASPNSFIAVDDRRKQVVLNDPRDTSTKLTNAPPKMFAFDHVFAEDAAQVTKTLQRYLRSAVPRVKYSMCG